MQALEGLRGVKKADAIHSEKKAVVVYDPATVTIEQMCETLQKSGFVASQKSTDGTTDASDPENTS